MRFQELNISETILKAVREIGYDMPTPIQQKAIPIVLAGDDLLGCAQTGTGKTAAFSIPMLQRMGSPTPGEARPVRGLILTPTRELALQIYENLCQYGRYTGRVAAVIFGGVSQNPQVETLRSGADIVVATPGRLWDLMGQGLLDISKVECFVLDEADCMLDMGFIQDIQRIVRFLPQKRQTLLFSATMPEEIAQLAKGLLHRPKYVSIAAASTPVERIRQGVYFVDKLAKRDLLKCILKQRSIPQTLVFTRTKHGADRVARDLTRAGIAAKSIHGDKSQNARQNALKQFKDYKIPVLVATDIAARGIDISELPLVVNYDLPNVPETYVHRIGRTGRAGQEGTALSFCDPSELPYLKDIESLTHVVIDAIEPPEGILQAEAQTAARYVQHQHTRERSARPSGKHSSKAESKPEHAGKAGNKVGKNVTHTGKHEKSTALPNSRQAAASRERQRAAMSNVPRRKGGMRQEPAASYKSNSIRAAKQRKNHRHSEEPETRVDIMTPHTGRPLSPSTAARIRAKVEAKLAERRAVQAKGTAVQPRTAKQGKAARKPQVRSGRGRGRG